MRSEFTEDTRQKFYMDAVKTLLNENSGRRKILRGKITYSEITCEENFRREIT